MFLDVCTECAGTYFDHGELAEMTRKRSDQLDDVEELVERDLTKVDIVVSRELLCPGCGTPMETYEYAFTSGILLDRCPKCYGVWADDCELQAIQDHIEDRPDPGTQGEQALEPEVRAAMLLNDMKAGSNVNRGRLGALTSLCAALGRRPLVG